jgi:hypothetical protein
MRRQWMIGGLIEEGGFLGGRFQTFAEQYDMINAFPPP